MHDLSPVPALASRAPVRIGDMSLCEVFPLAIASVTARQGQSSACRDLLSRSGLTVPEVGRAVSDGRLDLLGIARLQWFLCAKSDDPVQNLVRDPVGCASISEQSGAWVGLDLKGERLIALCERLCNLPLRKSGTDVVARTSIHDIGCILWKSNPSAIRIFSPRASSRDLHDAVLTAMRACSASL